MEIHQLAYVVAVAETGSFTRAAAREHVAQPGVSAQVRKLEAELGQELFDRAGGSITLTAAGQAMLPFARDALAAVAGVRTAIDEVSGLLRGRVAVGAVASVGGWFADTLASFHHAHPAVEITLVEGTSDTLLAAVASGDLDLALAGLADALSPTLQGVSVIDEELVAAVSSDHPLASRHSIGIRRLAAEALIALPRGTGGRSALERSCAAAGVKPRVAFEAGDPRVLMDLARRGLGLAILPASAPEDLHAIRIRPVLRSRLELVWRAGGVRSPAARTLITCARRSLVP